MSQFDDADLLGKLGSGESIASLCDAAGMTRDDFDAWWRETTRRRVPQPGEYSVSGASAEVTISRDAHGIPHIFAKNDRDLFFGFGWAMAEDRLFQLDWLRRKGLGRLSEIIGADGLELDRIARTVGLNRLAAAEWERLPGDVQDVLEAFSGGVNALIEEIGDNLPIEFDLLQYRPEPWTPIDSLAIENEFRWYLTGRFPIICMPELAKRELGEGPLLDEFLLGELDEESILHPGDYTAAAELPLEPVGSAVGDPDASTGSNNWVVSGDRTTNGKPLVGSDPHIAFEAVSCWYEAHLCGGSVNVAGMAYVGIPAIMFGRNERVAWGITNNICSLRDLYRERTDPDHPGCFEYDGDWEPIRELTETIKVRDGLDVNKTIRFSRNGPIVDDLLPSPADRTGPVSLKWLGLSQGGWLESLLAMDRAGSVGELRAAVRPWHVPTFSLVLADVDGNIGFQTAGRIPVRNRLERAYRKGWDPEDQWNGLMPFEEMPAIHNPERGWIGSANNRLAPNDFPHLLYGCWSNGGRGRRIREMLEDRNGLSVEDMRDMQQDALNLRAAAFVPGLINVLKPANDELTEAAIAQLEAWDFRSEPNSAAPTIFNVFFTNWGLAVSRERFDKSSAEFLAKGLDACAARLLVSDEAGWFSDGNREELIRSTFAQTLTYLTERFGSEPSSWTWDKLHKMPLKHVLSVRGDLSELLDHGGAGVRGDMTTVCNTGSGIDWTAASGAGYRLIADLSSNPPVLKAVDGQSQSGHPGSSHYTDQYDDWLNGRYHDISLSRTSSPDHSRSTLKSS